MEKVWIENPPLGTYTINVHAAVLSTSSQPFALAITGAGYVLASEQTLVSLQAGPSAACAAGSFKSSSLAACAQCAIGTFAAAIGATSCTACPAGRYQSQMGETSCAACPTGTVSPSTSSASSACIACLQGYSASAGLGACQGCVAGTFAPSTGASTCMPCPAGNYSSALASTCSDCASGTFSLQGMSSCISIVACAVGQYYDNTDDNECFDCPGEGSFNAHASSQRTLKLSI